MFAAGLALFTLSSLLCGVAGSGLELILFRALQGVGGAVVFATALALLAQTFEGRQFGLVLGIWGAVITLGLGLAPLLGGLLTVVSWRLIFFVNLPVGVAALAGFPLAERRRRQPMFDLALLRKPAFAGGLVAALGINGSLYAILLYLVTYLQNGLHYSALGTGIRLIVITGGAMATSVPAGRLSARLPARWLIGPGLGLVGLGLLLMGGLGAGSGWTHLIPGMAVAGAGSGLVTPPLASTAVRVVPPQDAGMASGVNSTFRQIGIAVSVAVLGAIFDSKAAAAAAATPAGRYAAALNDVLLIAACIAFTAGALALLLIRPRETKT